MMRPLIILALSLASVAGAAEPLRDVWVWPSAYRDTFRLTPPVKAGGVLLLQRHFTKSGAMEKRGPAPWAWGVPAMQVVFRFESRPQADVVVSEYQKLVDEWAQRGVRVTGLQLDYDSPTAKLGFYKSDILEIRRRLDKLSTDLKPSLSITGLTDWLRLKSFGQSFNDDVTVYFQIYRETQTHAEAETHLDHLSRARFPFKIGLLPAQELPREQMKKLENNSQFKGLAVFYGGSRI